jgi:hypothetical protein
MPGGCCEAWVLEAGVLSEGWSHVGAAGLVIITEKSAPTIELCIALAIGRIATHRSFVLPPERLLG